MEIVVFSDSHGDTATLDRIVKKHKDTVSTYLFLGDGLESMEYLVRKYPNHMFFSVKGNNDYGYDYPYERIVVFKGRNIFMTHGHRYMGGNFDKAIKNVVNKKKIDVVLFGHIHIPSVGVKKGVHYICPGSVSYPRSGSKKSYAILSLSEDDISARILEVEDEKY